MNNNLTKTKSLGINKLNIHRFYLSRVTYVRIILFMNELCHLRLIHLCIVM